MTGQPLGPPPALALSLAERHAPTVEELRAAMRLLTPTDAAILDWPTLVERLLAVGRTDVPVARLVEAHVDAQRIHAQAGTAPVPDALYAVWASRSHATGIKATPTGEEWVLDGTLRFASGSGIVDRALVPVWVDADRHVLLDLDVSEWTFDPSVWRTRAMSPARTYDAVLAEVAVAAQPVGAENFYLDRPGFFPGGVGVAAAWAGGAARVLDLVAAASPRERRSDAQAVRLGRMWTELAAMVAVVRETAILLDAPTDDPRHVSTTARAAVATGIRRLLADARLVAGAAGLARNEDLTRAIDDVFLFVAQQNEDADAAWLGSSL